MTGTLKSHEVDSAVAAIRALRTAIVEAEAQIVDCLKNRVSTVNNLDGICRVFDHAA